MRESVLLTIRHEKYPLRRVQHRENEMLNVPGMSPLSVVFLWGAHRIVFENQEIGNIQIGAHYEQGGRLSRHEVKATLYDAVPERVTDAVFARLRPFAQYVARKHEESLIREQQVMDNMLHRIGPVDSPKVKTPYDGPRRDVEALLFPGMLQRVLGDEFSAQPGERSGYNNYEFLFSYEEDGIRIPAFRIYTGVRPEGPVEIWGRGDRERARNWFVSEALRDAARTVAETAADPVMLDDARRLVAILPPSARGVHLNGTVSDVRKKCATARNNEEFHYSILMYARSPTEEAPTREAAFGDGFTVQTGFSLGRATRMRVSHDGRPIMDDNTGFIPGIPEPEKVLIIQGAVRTMSALWPEFAEAHAREAMGEKVRVVAEEGISERLLEEFGAP